MKNKEKKLKIYLKSLKKKNFFEDKNSKGLSFFYKGKNNKALFDRKLKNTMKNISILLNENIRINLHGSPNEKYHDMIILQRKKTNYPVHKHPLGGETIHILEGKIKVIFLSSGGKIKKTLDMDTKNNIIYRIPGNVFHTYKILSNYAIFHENKDGPYVRNKNMVFLKNKSK